MVLSWQLDPALEYVDLQVEGNGEGWLSGGLVDEHTSMVSTPPHQVLVFDYSTGESQFLSMEGYDSSNLKPVDPTTYGVAPMLLQGAGGKLFMRYRQSLATASVPVDLTAESNFMYAWAGFGYPAMHDLEGAMTINWAAGTCTPSIELPPIEGYWLLLVPFLALIVTWTCLKRTDCGRSLLQRRLGPITPLPAWFQTMTFDAIPTLQTLKWGEVSIMTVYMVLQAALLVYWSLQEGGLGLNSTGIAFGKAGLTNLMMTYLPVSKTSVWVQVCGLSFERAVKFHRQLSYLALATMTIHLVCLALVGPIWQIQPLDSGVIIAYGLLAYISFTFMSLTAMLRRWCFELFRYTHYLFVVGTIFVLLHAPDSWQYMVLPCAVHFVDFFRRWIGIWRNPTTARLQTFPDQITQVGIFSARKNGEGKWNKKPLEPMSLSACQQWHPISISTAGSEVGNEAAFSLHVKSLGKGTWTNDLYQLAAQGPATPHSHDITDDKSPTAQVTNGGGGGGDEVTPSAPSSALKIMVDGPYGKLSIDLRKYRHLMLFAGGIGLTPMTSILSYISHQKSNQQLPFMKAVTLVWVVRSEALFDGFASWLEQMLLELNMHQGSFFTLELYVTGGQSTDDGTDGAVVKKAKVKQLGTRFVDGGGGSNASSSPQVHTHQGRPILFKIFVNLVEMDKGEQTNTAVVACAPKPLLRQVQRQCVLRDVDLHMEEFAW